MSAGVRVLTSTAVGVLVALAAAGCGRSVPAGPGPSVSSVATAAAPSEPPTSTGGLPAGFPADIPVPEGRIVRAEGADTPAGAAYLVSIEVPQSLPDATAWYEEQLKAGGWTNVQRVATSTTLFLTGMKGKVRLTVTGLPGHDSTGNEITSIGLTVDAQK